VIAKNISQAGFSSFDGLHFTNGYHPLWQLLVSGLSYGVRDDSSLLLVTILLGIILSIVSLLLIYLLLTKFRISPEWKAISLLLGVFFILLPSWYALEPFLATTLFLCSLYYYFQRYHDTSLKSQCVLGLLLSITVLARLDAIFVTPFFLLSLFIRTNKSDLKKLVALFYLACFYAIPILIYVGLNLFYTGHLTPISGAIKSSFPEITISNLPLQLGYLVRVAPPVISSLCITLTLVYTLANQRQKIPPLLQDLLVINIGVLCFSGYEFLFQKDAMWGLRPWHFAIPNIVMLLSVAPVVSRFLPKSLPVLIIPLLILVNLIAVNQKFLTPTATNPIKSDLFATANWIRQNTTDDEVIAVTDPGVIAFFSGRKTISLDGLTNDFEYQKIVQKQKLQSYLNENNVSYIGIFARGHDTSLPVNHIQLKSRLFDSFDTLILEEGNRVFTSPYGSYSVWKNQINSQENSLQ
jgi:hypothetical protein